MFVSETVSLNACHVVLQQAELTLYFCLQQQQQMIPAPYMSSTPILGALSFGSFCSNLANLYKDLSSYLHDAVEMACCSLMMACLCCKCFDVISRMCQALF